VAVKDYLAPVRLTSGLHYYYYVTRHASQNLALHELFLCPAIFARSGAAVVYSPRSRPPYTEVRAPLVVRSFEDLPSRQPSGAGFNPAAFRHGISFRYGVDDDRGRAADRERRVHLTA
jgi:hypothetical protein